MIGAAEFLASVEKDGQLKAIAEKVLQHKRISDEDGLALFEKGSLGFVGSLAIL